MIDLHAHSTASDGSLSPSELVIAAKDANLSAIALTDHDTVQGLPEFMEAARSADIMAVPGIELAASWYHTSIHILGYGIDHSNSDLQTFLNQLIENRRQRNLNILDMLNRKNIDVTSDELLDISKDATPGRPHIAQLLLNKGYVSSIKEAFQKHIGNPHLQSIPHALPMPEVSIEIIHTAGGIASWAHPTGINDRPASSVRKIARTLKEKGLDAIEAYYSEYSTDQHHTVISIAEDESLKVTGGSDFHGDALPGVALGTGRGDLNVPDEVLDRLFS